MKISLTCIILSLFFLSGCRKEANEAIIPAYLKVSSVQVVADDQQGGDSHLITEVWIYVDSVFQGTFPIPAEVPILTSEKVTIELFAGIRENGQALSPIMYPFYIKSTIAFEHGPQTTMTVIPEYKYNPQVNFALVETFGSGNQLREDLDGDFETFFVVSSDGALQGQSAKGTLTAQHPTIEVATIFPMENLPTNGTVTFLEIDYKSDIPVSVGLRGRQVGGDPISAYKITLFPDDQWQKVYINFTPELQASQLSSYQAIFLARFDPMLKLDVQNVYLDNIKMLHF